MNSRFNAFNAYLNCVIAFSFILFRKIYMVWKEKSKFLPQKITDGLPCPITNIQDHIHNVWM